MPRAPFPSTRLTAWRSGVNIMQHDCLELTRIPTFQDYLTYSRSMQDELARRRAEERALFQDQKPFCVPGYCYVCQKPTEFLVDFQHAYDVDGALTPNWRERLVCPSCQLNNRIRASLHAFGMECTPRLSDVVFLTEQTTPLFRWLEARYQKLVASEHLGERVPRGKCSSEGIRNEDLTRLSFPDESFHHVLSFDVMEHIPDYRAAFSEVYRCLRPGGSLLFSVPFKLDAALNIVRARIDANGDTILLLPAEYHGDPISNEGCLCYYHFGWQLLEELREIGFCGVYALTYWSKTLGYLGRQQCLFIARKPAA